MRSAKLSDYRDLWTTHAKDHALIRVDEGFMVYNKVTKRILIIDHYLAQDVITRMIHAHVDVWGDLAATS